MAMSWLISADRYAEARSRQERVLARLSTASVIAALEAAAKDADEKAEALVKEMEERGASTEPFDTQLLDKYRDLRRQFHIREIKRGGFSE